MGDGEENSGLVGKVLLGYEITKLAATGGSSEIYRAKATGLNNRSVVIKIAKRPNTKYNQDLESLAKILDSFNHPNIVGIINSGEYEGRKFLVLERLESSFADVMHNWNSSYHDPSYTSLTKIAIGVLKGLEAAHDWSVVHNDITPGNILINDTVAKISDFFTPEIYAEEKKVDNLSSLKSVQERKEGDVVDARMKYLAPEQKGLIDASVDGRADVYALGVVLYEALMGNVPVGNFDKISEKHKNIPKWFEKAIEKALSSNPLKRFRSEEMRKYLEQGLEGKLDEPSVAFKVAKGVGYVLSRPVVWPCKAVRGIYDFFDLNSDLIVPLGMLSAVVGLVGTLVTIGICDGVHSAKVRTALKDKTGLVAYVRNEEVGIMTPGEAANSRSAMYRTPAKDLVGVRWRGDGKKLLLVDEPKKRGWKGDVEDTALYVFDLDTKTAGILFDITNNPTYKAIKEVYWSKSDANKVYVRIDDGWYDLNINGAEKFISPNVPFSRVEKLDELDLDKDLQLSSSDGEISIVSPNTELTFKLIDKNWRTNTKIIVESAAWYFPKEKK